MKTIGSVLKRLLLALGGSASDNYYNDITLVDKIAALAENGQISSSVIQGGGGGGGGAMYFPSQTVNVATNAEMFRITNGAITTQTVVVECSFASPSSVTSDVTWTSYDGYIAFYGTCTAATTADVTLSNVETPSPQTPLAIANGGTGASNAADARANLGIDVAIGDAITNQEVLLWTNPSPGSYATGTVSVDLSSYRRVRIDFCPWGNPNLINTQEFYIGSSSSGITGCLSYTSFNTDNVSSAATFLNGVYREFDVYSGGIVFQNGQMIYAGYVYQNWDSRAVPYRIWGVK